MTRAEELELLIAEQQKDDAASVVYPEPGRPKGVAVIPLDKTIGEKGKVSLADRICGLEYDLEEGDDVGQLVTFIGRDGVQHGHVLVQIQHGTYNGYHNQGCHCLRCRRAATTYVVALQRKARRREQAARPDRVCASQTCDNTFRPIPSTKMYCSQRCAWSEGKRRQRLRAAA